MIQSIEVRLVPAGARFVIDGEPHMGEYVKVRNAISGAVVRRAGKAVKHVVASDGREVMFSSDYVAHIICESCLVEVL